MPILKRDLQKMNLEELLELTYSSYWRHSKGSLTALINAKSALRILNPSKDITTISRADLDNLVESLRAQGNSPATINRKLSAISKMLTVASDRGLIQSKPRIPKLREAEHRLRWVTQEEEKAILDYFSDTCEVMRDFTIVSVDTGLRVSETLRFNPETDLNEGLLTIWETKSGRPRSIPGTRRVLETLKAHPYGIFINQDQVNYQWSKMRKALGFSKDLVVHSLRHTFCSRLVQRGVSIFIVKELAGHSSVNVTMRYAHLDPENFRKAVEVLEA